MVAFCAEQEDVVLTTLGKDKFFIQAWLKYAKSVSDTEDVYDFIVDKGIGTGFASTYITISDYLEHSIKDLSKAESLLRRGKEYMMTHESSLKFELAKLEKAYASFERRVRTDHT